MPTSHRPLRYRGVVGGGTGGEHAARRAGGEPPSAGPVAVAVAARAARIAQPGGDASAARPSMESIGFEGSGWLSAILGTEPEADIDLVDGESAFGAEQPSAGWEPLEPIDVVD